MSIRLRLLGGFAALLMVAGIAIGAVVYILAQNGMGSISKQGAAALQGRAMDQLESVRSSKASHVDDLFKSIRDQIVTFSEDLTVVDAARDMKDSFRLLLNEAQFFPWSVDEARADLEKDFAGENYLRNPLFQDNVEIAQGYSPRPAKEYLPPDEISIHLQYMYIHGRGNPNKVGEKHLLDTNEEILTYNEDHKKFHPIIRNYLETFGYYDIFIVDQDSGKIIYSVFKEKDYATSLKTGPYKDTNLARCFRETDEAGRKGEKDFVSIVDFAPYEPSYNAPAAFIGSPIIDTSGQYLGVLVFQMPVDKINTVMLSGRKWQDVGLGETGETYMVGPDFKMRSQSRFTESGVDTINREVKTQASEEALAGRTGAGAITNYLGERVLSSWQPLDVSGLKYALIAEIGESEALASAYAISDEARATQNNILTATALVLLGALAAGIIGTFFVVRSITGPLGRIHDFAQTVEGGDLDAELPGSYPGELDDLKVSIQGMVGQLKNRLGFSQGVMDGVSSCFPCIMVGPDSRITFVNPALMDIMEKSGKPEDHHGQTTGKFFHNDDSRATEIVHSLENDCRMSEELEITTPSGEQKVLSMNATPIKDLDGELLGVFTVYYDLTTIRKQEAEISSQNERMVEASDQANVIADNVATAVAQLMNQLSQVRSGSDLQSQRANETATAMGEMNSTVLEVARNASRASDSATQARDEATEGERTVEQVIAAIGHVHDQMNQLRSNMDHLGEQAQSIGQVITVIEDIADQTNLLALNAAIEAARAGEAGRGFAVVADEVRKLAEKTMAATKEVSEAIRSIQAGAKASIQATESATTSVESSTELAGQSGERLRTIVSIVAETANQVASIATASEEQSAASEEVSQAVEEIDRISGDTAEGVNQAGEAVTALSEQTDQLTALIGRLRG